MRKILVLISVLLTVAILAGCTSTVRDVPELLEPVGVSVTSAQVQRDTVYNITTYAAEMVPYVEEVSFEKDGYFGEFLVALGDTVIEGQVLATMDVESYQEQIDAMQEQIAYDKRVNEYADKERTAEIGIAKVELERLREEGASSYMCVQKEQQIKKLELKLKQTLELRKIDLDRKYAAIADLQEKIEDSQLLAPFSGQVIYLNQIQNGNAVNKTTTVICLADETRLSLQTDFVKQAEVESADKVYVKILDKEYDIEYLPFDTENYLSMVLTGKKMKVRFSVDAPDGELQSGQSGTIVVLHDYKENALTIPINMLYRDRKGRHVYKLEDGEWVRCPVTVGAITDTKVEILDGLSEGDVVRGSE